MSIILNGTTGITTPDVTADGLTVDSTTLVVDEANNRVGIGTSSPNQKLALASGAGVGAAIEMAGNGNTLGTTSLYVGQGVSGDAYVYQRNATQPLVFGTANTERMRIDSAGRVTMPYQPAFRATGSSGYATRSTPIDYTTTSLNIGGHYNTSTYKFTAPVSGHYYFDACAIAPSTSSAGGIHLRVNGGAQARAYHQDNERSRSVSSIFYLNAGDSVDVGVEEQTSYFLGAGYGWFLGYLIG